MRAHQISASATAADSQLSLHPHSARPRLTLTISETAALTATLRTGCHRYVTDPLAPERVCWPCEVDAAGVDVRDSVLDNALNLLFLPLDQDVLFACCCRRCYIG